MKTGKILACLALLMSSPAWANTSLSYGLHYGSELFDDADGSRLQALVFSLSHQPTPKHRLKLSSSYNRLKADTGQPTRRGWGDTQLAYQYRLFPNPNQVLDLEAKVKLPTASEANGLGNGEIDYTLATGLSQKLGQHWLHGKLAYKWRGETTLNDGYQLQLGDSYSLSPRLSLGGSLNYVAPSRDSLPARQELLLNVSYKLTRDSGITLYSNKGLSAASPGLSGGIMFNHSFRD